MEGLSRDVAMLILRALGQLCHMRALYCTNQRWRTLILCWAGPEVNVPALMKNYARDAIRFALHGLQIKRDRLLEQVRQANRKLALAERVHDTERTKRRRLKRERYRAVCNTLDGSQQWERIESEQDRLRGILKRLHQ